MNVEHQLQLSPYVMGRLSTISLSSNMNNIEQHMLNYIDEVENENRRHMAMIENRFHSIRDELQRYFQRNNNRQSIDGRKRHMNMAMTTTRLSEAGNDFGDHWRSLLIEMERDLQLNRITMNGISRNLSRLRAICFTDQDMAQTMIVTPKTNQFSIMSSSSSSIEAPRHENDYEITSPMDPIFKIPTFVSSDRTKRTKSIKPKTLKRKFDQIAERANRKKPKSLKAIINETKFWSKDLCLDWKRDQRFINVIYGLPNGDDDNTLTDEQWNNSIGWIYGPNRMEPGRLTKRTSMYKYI
ncbi:hypothetical protein RDWZM_002029 [Blomia tropicalis]|uniref:Uncharacterized protein n=1 Tax=Blomia tropicalis TaxID=40697 RepID=A0A9Q0MD27_BLOTA|nr:hypothetical protein RDWZM_002029 [Blomia tropicalis]